MQKVFEINSNNLRKSDYNLAREIGQEKSPKIYRGIKLFVNVKLVLKIGMLKMFLTGSNIFCTYSLKAAGHLSYFSSK